MVSRYGLEKKRLRLFEGTITSNMERLRKTRNLNQDR